MISEPIDWSAILKAQSKDRRRIMSSAETIGIVDEKIENLPNILRTLRKNKKVSVNKLATMSGLSTATIYSIERGKRFPSLVTLMQYLEPLGVDILSPLMS